LINWLPASPSLSVLVLVGHRHVPRDEQRWDQQPGIVIVLVLDVDAVLTADEPVPPDQDPCPLVRGQRGTRVPRVHRRDGAVAEALSGFAEGEVIPLNRRA